MSQAKEYAEIREAVKDYPRKDRRALCQKQAELLGGNLIHSKKGNYYEFADGSKAKQ